MWQSVNFSRSGAQHPVTTPQAAPTSCYGGGQGLILLLLLLLAADHTTVVASAAGGAVGPEKVA